MYKIFIKIIKIIIKSSPVNILLRGLTIILNSVIPPIMTFLLGKITLSLTSNEKLDLIFFLSSYILICFFWNLLSRYISIRSQKSNDKIVLSLREYMIDLQQKIPNDILECPDFIRVRERADVFLNTYALRYLSSTERLITIGLTIVSYSLIFWKINPLFIIIVVGASLPGFFCRAKYVPEMRRMYEELQEDRSYQGWYKNSLTDKNSLKEIRLWGLEKEFYAKYRCLTQSILKRQRGHYYRHGFIGGGIESLSFGLGLGASLICGVFFLQAGVIQVDGLVIIINSIIDVQDTFISSFYNILSYKESSLYAKDLLEIENIASCGLVKFKKPDSNKSVVEFHNVFYQYPSIKKNVLDNISIRIKHGEKVAIVGENGSGKTTFCKLLLGLYSPISGKVCIDNSVEVTVTFQDYCRYDLTIRDNISLGKIEYQNNDLKLNEKMILSGFKETFEKMNLNLETELGTVTGKGINLSGGEWQKLAITRCFFNDANNRVVVLDEPHASLDPMAEADLYKYYFSLINNEQETVIFVTHRLSSANLCDRILVFDSGKIVEDGSHQELMKLKGHYYKLFSAQKKHFE
jgi:ABC-type multidrug transport system fused ATPase/permease subunit